MGHEISGDFAERLAGAFAAYARERSGAGLDAPLNISVGWDCRLSSPVLAAAVVRGLRSAGAHVLRLGICPAPLLVFSVHHHAILDGGIMVTGGDRPAGQNGFRLYLGKEEISGEELRKVHEPVPPPAARAQGKVADLHMLPIYRRYVYQECLSIDSPAQGERKRIVIDLGNGTAATVFPQVLHPRFLGLGLNCVLDGRFPNRAPWALTEADLEPLADSVRAQDACFGIALDADSGRIALLDERGHRVRGEKLREVIAGAAPRKKPYYPFDDAIFSALKICEIASRLETPMSALFEEKH